MGFQTIQEVNLEGEGLVPPLIVFFNCSGVPAATFKHHTGAISSVEWHPDDSSVFASAGSDDQVRS